MSNVNDEVVMKAAAKSIQSENKATYRKKWCNEAKMMETAKNRFAVLYPRLKNNNNKAEINPRAVTKNNGMFILNFGRPKVKFNSICENLIHIKFQLH